MAYYSPFVYSPTFTNSSSFIDSPASPLTKNSLLSNLSDTLTTTLITETTNSPIISPYFGYIGSETVVKPLATNMDILSPIIPAYSPISPVYSPTVTITPSSTYSPYFPNTAFPTASVNVNYTPPIIGYYSDLNSDYETQQTIIKYVRMKMLDEWLYTDFKDLFGYFAFDNGKVKLVSSHDSNAYKKYSEKQLEQIVDYIKKELLSHKVVSKLMHKFIKETGSQWVKVPHEDHYVKKMLGNRLKKIIKEKL